MSREIKFRVWNEKLEEMYKLKKANYLGSTGIIDTYIGGDNAVWMQYTGLKDKNGVEIYEGDVVNCTRGCPHEIVWLHEYGGTYVGGMPAWYLSGIKEGYAWTGSEEVIGNIYENPELMEASK